MNLDFSNNALFSWYVILLMFSGLVMLGMSLFNSSGLSKGWRVLNVLFGLGFFGYGVYLGFLFHGGSYFIFFKAFLLPVFMVINFFRSLSMRQRTRAAQTAQSAMYGQPPAGYPQGQGYPGQPPAGYGAPVQGGYGAPAPGTVPPPQGYPQQPGYGYPQQLPGYGAPQQTPGQQG